mgnify:CR=1 FL=1
MKVLNLVVGILLAASPAFGIGLEELQDKALEKREILKRYIVNLEKSEKDSVLARAGYYPSVDVSYQMNKIDDKSPSLELGGGGGSLDSGFGGSVDSSFSATDSSIFYSAVTWNLFNGFKDRYSIESAELLTEVEELQLDGLTQDIQLNVALQYLNVYERRANLEVARKNYETLQKIYQDGKNRLDVGLIDRNELLKFKVDLDDTLIQVEAAKGGLEKSVILLGRVVGEDLRLALLDFEEFENIPGGKDLEGNMALMLARRSELQVFDKLIEASMYQRQADQSGYYPKVDLVGSYSYFDDDLIGGRGNVGSEELRAQLVLSMNLYRGGATQARVAKARLETQGLHYDMKERKDTLKTELQNLHIDYSVSLRNIEVALVSIEQAEENLRITRLKYNEGLQRESDLLDAVANLSRAQYNYVAVLQNVFSNHFKILRMVEAF